MDFELKDPPPIRTTGAKPDVNAWIQEFPLFLKEHPGEWYVGKTVPQDEGRGSLDQIRLRIKKNHPDIEATLRTEPTSETDDTKVIRFYGRYIGSEPAKEEDHITAGGEREVSSENVMPGRLLKVGNLLANIESVVPNGTGSMLYILQVVGQPKKKAQMTITLAKGLPVTLSE